MLLTPSAQRHEGDATAREFRVRNGIDIGDASGNKDGGGLWSFAREGHGDVDEGGERIRVLGLEAEAAAGHIDAGDDWRRAERRSRRVFQKRAPRALAETLLALHWAAVAGQAQPRKLRRVLFLARWLPAVVSGGTWELLKQISRR